MFAGCRNTANTGVQIIWENGKAKAINIPKEIIGDVATDSLPIWLHVVREDDKDATPIIGHLQTQDAIIFEPLVPFSAGSSYVVTFQSKKVSRFTVPRSNNKPAELLTIYPRVDTIPENLLKIYMEFSQPMQEGRSKDFILLTRNGTDTLKDVFLDLQPELWNTDRTVLTLWLDPGRIKRGLQPNLRLGNPLHQHDQYQLTILPGWMDGQGNKIKHAFTKRFFATIRDSLSPDPVHWVIFSDSSSPHKQITIELGEPLDHFLATDGLQVLSEEGKNIDGYFTTSNQDKTLHFTPASFLPTGTYVLRVPSRLEDLAGNNLNRVFDRDVTHSKQPSDQLYHDIKFIIR